MNEAEVLFLPGLPLINLVGENPVSDLWTFQIETPAIWVVAMEGDSPAVMIDYVHPGACEVVSTSMVPVGGSSYTCYMSLQTHNVSRCPHTTGWDSLIHVMSHSSASIK